MNLYLNRTHSPYENARKTHIKHTKLQQLMQCTVAEGRFAAFTYRPTLMQVYIAYMLLLNISAAIPPGLPTHAHNNTTTMQYEKNTEYKDTNANTSTHSEMGPV